MKKYRVVWQIELEKVVEARDRENAEMLAQNLDCQHDGDYVEDSWELLKVTELTKADMEFKHETGSFPEEF